MNPYRIATNCIEHSHGVPEEISEGDGCLEPRASDAEEDLDLAFEWVERLLERQTKGERNLEEELARAFDNLEHQKRRMANKIDATRQRESLCLAEARRLIASRKKGSEK